MKRASVVLSAADIRHNTEMYDKYHDEYHMIDGWLPGHKEENFETMLEIANYTGVPISGTSCLDVGCGTGDFSAYLERAGVSAYTGIDIYQPSLAKARFLYPNKTFLAGDFLAHQFSERFDYVFCSGALTVKQQTLDNYDFLTAAVAKMRSLATIGCVFNCLTDDDAVLDPELFFYNEATMLSLCRSLAKTDMVVAKHASEYHEVHVYIYNPQSMQR